MNFTFREATGDRLAEEHIALLEEMDAREEELRGRVRSRKDDVAGRLAELEREQRVLNNLDAQL